jgi:hypothetical protein
LTAGTWAFEAQIAGRCLNSGGARFSLDFNGTHTSIDYAQLASSQNTTWTGLQRFTAAGATGPVSWIDVALDAFVLVFGQVIVTGSGSLILRGLKGTSGSMTVWPTSSLKAWQIS